MSAPPFSHHSKPVNLILESFFLFLAITTNNAVSYAEMKEVAAIMRGVRLEIDRWKEQWL